MEAIPGVELIDADELRARAENAEEALGIAQKTIEHLRAQLEEAMPGELIDLTRETAPPPELKENEKKSNVSGMVIVAGTRHGVGSTTVALNIAAGYASEGSKTLLIELDPKSPMLNSYFEFTQISFGIDEAIAAYRMKNYPEMKAGLILPKKLSPKNHLLKKAYKKLPTDLHFMLYSNRSLAEGSDEVGSLEFAEMLEYLRYEYGYKSIVVNVSCENYKTVSELVAASQTGCKLYTVMTQDTVAVASASKLIDEIGNTSENKNFSGALFVINRYSENVPVTKQKIAKYLNQSINKFIMLSEDTEGYYKAISEAQPYVSDGKYRNEYVELYHAL